MEGGRTLRPGTPPTSRNAPRTDEQLESQLGGADVRLDAALLDRIDEIVPPGTNFSYADAGFTPSALADPALRRR